jgi:HAD superfamily hydrolase (TIGR01549 family)
MKEIHILVTGVGRRIELLQAFRQAALNLNINLKIYGADMSGTAPALAYCDYTRKVCAMHDSRYIQELVDICKKDKIDLVMPTIDTDLLILSRSVEVFKNIGTKVLISKLDKILICRDKNNTGKFFESCGLKAPKTYNNYKEYFGPYPCFIKPKDGSSSINAFKVEDKEELSVYAGQIEDYIIQPFISGREFTIDIFCDFDGNPIYITPRERTQVRAGEVLKTQIYMDEIMINEAKVLCKAFKPCGPMTVQLIQDKNTGENYYIEINPRYGGGAPLSMKSGARSAEALLRLLCGEKVEYQRNSSCNGAIYSRFDQSVCISEGDDTQPIKGVIFDLDDTLYSEKQYVKSGYKKIGEYLGRSDAAEKLYKFFEEGKLAIDEYLSEIHENDKKVECLKIYRNQLPEIELYDGVIELIEKLKVKGIKVGIITDGRPEGQRSKLKILGLDKIIEDIIITDELGGIQFRKPCDIAFRVMQRKWGIPFEQIIYVGDNLNKDFQACRQLGMRWKYFRNEDGLYFNDEYITKNMIEKLQDIRI